MDAFIERYNQGTARLQPQDEANMPTLKRAGVLIPLYENPDDGEIYCLLTVRSSRMRSHAGEVCLPGGKVDEEDKDVIDTALREAEEEIGLPRDAVRIVGCMSPTLSLHLLHVTPVLGIIPHDFIPRPNPEEVEECFSVPLSVIKNPTRGIHSYQDMTWFLPWRMHTFEYEERTIWGLTSECLVRLCILSCEEDHRFPYDVKHPDGTEMEDWFRRVAVLPSLEIEARDASLRRSRKKK